MRGKARQSMSNHQHTANTHLIPCNSQHTPHTLQLPTHTSYRATGDTHHANQTNAHTTPATTLIFCFAAALLSLQPFLFVFLIRILISTPIGPPPACTPFPLFTLAFFSCFFYLCTLRDVGDSGERVFIATRVSLRCVFHPRRQRVCFSRKCLFLFSYFFFHS
jgi:hypothetical protein